MVTMSGQVFRPIATTMLLGIVLCCIGTRFRALAETPVSFADVQRIVVMRCQTCHSETPTQQDIYEAPKGVKLDDAQEIKFYSVKIMQQVVTLKLMPLGNVTQITEEERTAIGSWVAAGAKID
jgi:uncharacterized membrane protein